VIQIPGGLCRDELDEMFIEQTKLLTEATALLERWRNACGYAGFLRDETDTFLSRAPAQHAAPVCHDTSPHACSFQPAAPEPSGDTGDAVIHLVAWVVRNAEDLADVVGDNPDLLREMALSAKRVHDCDVKRAEATRAAVLAEIDAPGVGCLSSLVDRIEALLRPTPGHQHETRDETGEKL